MPGKSGYLNYLLAELRRRHVFRVAGAYMICAWITLQIADVVFPPLMVPSWVMTVLVVLAVIGLPLVIMLSWVFDITPEGVVRTEPADEITHDDFHWNPRWIDYLIIAVLLAILTFVLAQDRSENPPLDQSIAVLPFADLSTEGDQRYFTDGMSEALIDSLSRLPELKVASRTSSFAYRDASVDVREMAEKLGVGAILEGSVRKSGNDIRVDARLVDGRHGYNLWSQSYEGSMGEIFEVQDEIARAIVSVLEVKLLGNGQLVETATEDQDAYDLYLRGRAYLHDQGTLENLDQAIDYFEQALERDPVFGLAMAGLCTAHWEQYEITRDSEQAEAAIAICMEADLYDSHAETHVALGSLYLGTGKLEQAYAALERALAIEPRNAEALAARGRVHRANGEFEQAEADIRRAIALDPAYWRHYSSLGSLYYSMGEFDRAIEQFSHAAELEPGSPIPHFQVGAILLLQGHNLRAADAFRTSLERSPTARAYSNAGTNYFFSQEFAQAEEMFREAASINPSDHRFHGHLAHAIVLQEERSDEAARHYRTAVELARERLEVNPGDHSARSSAASYLARLGRIEEANAELSRLAEAEYLDVTTHHDMGTAYLFLDRHEKAIEHLREAALAGYPRHLMKVDPNLEPLLQYPAFRELLRDDAD